MEKNMLFPSSLKSMLERTRKRKDNVRGSKGKEQEMEMDR